MPDYSCNITVKNQLDVDLVYLNKGNVHGYWSTDPPSIIKAKSTVKFGTTDNWGTYGSDGWVKYRVKLKDVKSDSDRPELTISFDCPTGANDNTFDMTVTTAASIFSFSNTDFPKRDHPLNVTGTVDFNYNIKTTTVISSVKIPSPKLNVYNSKGELHKKNNMEVWNNSDPSSFEDDTTSNVAGSYRPVSFDIRQDSYLTLVVDVDEILKSVPFYLSGKYLTDDKVIFNSDPQFFTSAGSTEISMKVQPDWSTGDFPWALVGNIIWRLELSPTSQICQLNSSRLELYALTPSLPKFFYNQIKVVVLRTIVLPAHDSGETDWVTYCIKAAFGNYGFQYFDGKKTFAETSSGGNYQLTRWTKLINTKSNVNCWDQAGIVQIAVGLGLNSATQWKYMEPYGYLQMTKLIGIGDCNNPFCRRDGTPAVIGNNDSKRTQFGSHTFVTVSSKGNSVADATVLPHLASENLPQYVDASIQKTADTTLYSSTGTKPGTASDATDRSGITSIDQFDSSYGGSAGAFATVLKTIMSKAGIDLAATNSPSHTIPFINLDLPRLHGLFSQTNLRILYHAHDISPAGSRLSWVFGTDADPITVEIAIRDSEDSAKDYLAHYLKGYSEPAEGFFRPAPPEIAKGDLSLISTSHKHSEMIWVRGNVFASVAGPVDIQTIDKDYLKGIDKVFMDGTKLPDKGPGDVTLAKPVVHGINVPQKVRVGEEFSAYASVTGSSLSRAFNGANDIIVFLSKDDKTHTYRFRAEIPGTEKLLFAFAHSTTGAVTTKEVEVQVVEG